MRLYDTLTGTEREFVPAANRVKMYVCGITPYAPSHMGHAMSYIVFDVLRRYLEFLGYEVDHVQNFTDMDDKLIQRARQESVEPGELAERHIEEFMERMAALNVKEAKVYPRATREIDNMTQVIAALVDKGYAYTAAGDVYFRVTRSADYGKLSRRTLDGMIAGARVQVGTAKEHPMDFTLWKAAKQGEPSWDSPWGPGRPGWHIECSAMSLAYLGETLDIHGGGQDLIFPHHENEVAQSEAYTGQAPFVRYWIHNGLLHMGDDKMSKSLGNLVSLELGLKEYEPDVLRVFFLSSHYRSPQAYSAEGLLAAAKAAERLHNSLRDGSEEVGSHGLDPGPYRQRFVQAMDSDLNTPQALAALFDLAREINRARQGGQGVAQAQETLKEIGGVLGLTFHPPSKPPGAAAESFIDLLVDTRVQLRAAKQYVLADHIRAQLEELGVTLEDTPKGTRWTYR